MSRYHTSIMVDQVIEGLQIQPGHWYVDATIGGGGHALAILAAGGCVLGIDQDRDALAEVQRRLLESGLMDGQSRITLAQSNFVHLAETIERELNQPISGIFFDLGVSSHQLDQLDRGFSFDSANLDMRMDQSIGTSAEQLVAILPEADLVRILYDLGEERYAKSIARAIIAARRVQPITSGQQLAAVVAGAVPPSYRHGRIHPATRTFQALRLAVNAEMDVLQMVLPQAVDVLAPGGRLAVISFHSLEDRMVKQFFASTPDLMVVSKKPIVASDSEVATNPRSRSAKLRLAEKRS